MTRIDSCDAVAYDVVVVGGGHAGTEAAAAAARMGATVGLVTHSRARIGEMSCNPAIGGLAKGQLVHEIDALDGIMGRAIDRASIHSRLLNRSKGPAVQGLRAQADRELYRDAVQSLLAAIPNLSIIEGSVEAVQLRAGPSPCVQHIVLDDGRVVHTGALVITTGTFLRGMIHEGRTRTPGGRVGDAPAQGLACSLEAAGLVLGRLKTGTPARLDGRTIAWERLEKQPGETPPKPFSFLTERIGVPQIDCAITHTNPRTHAIIRANLGDAPLFSGQIQGTGPRYCPSIEDKVVRFPTRESHQIFLEPEGLKTHTVYPNGISTSLPADVQRAVIASIEGLENAVMERPGYAIEYDFADARALRPTLEVRHIAGLFLAGQINGTTGYEEAGGQGLMAGINAALRAQGGHRTFTLDRADAYIGVMIDDLTHLGTTEPYRMFTSRAEYRLSIRGDNADQRLTPKGIAVGCVGRERRTAFEQRLATITRWRERLQGWEKTPSALKDNGVQVNQDGVPRSAFMLMGMADMEPSRLDAIWPEIGTMPAAIRELMATEARYERYLIRQQQDIESFRRDESLLIPEDTDFAALPELSAEIVEKLSHARPATIGAAARVSGVTPVAIGVLLRVARRAGECAA